MSTGKHTFQKRKEQCEMYELYQRGKSKLVYGIKVSKYAIKSTLFMRTTIFINSSVVSTDNFLNYFGMDSMRNLLH